MKIPLLFARRVPRPMRAGLALCSLGACLLLGALPAQAHGFHIDSAQELDADPSTAEVDLVVSYDGSLGALYAFAYAKSRDGLVRGGPAPMGGPVPVPQGRRVHMSVFVARPPGAGAQHTDVLLATVQNASWAIVATPRVDWAHDWPALAEAGSAQQGSAQAGTDGLLPRQDLASPIIASLGDEDFAALDLLLQEWNTPDARDESGEWKLKAFNAAFASMAAANWDAAMATVQRWKKFNPKSAGAAVAEARLWMAHAWELPGYCACGTPAKPGPEAKRMFDERMRHAEAALRASRAYAVGNPLWYQASLDLAVQTRRDARFTQRVFDEAVRRHPLYQPLYLAMANTWMPRDGQPGTWPPLAALADRMVALSHAADGDDNYAWFYARIDEQLPLEVNLLWRGPLPWARLRASFRSLVARYPSADNYNRFARSACRAHDRETYMELALKIRHNVEPDLWPGNFSMDMCNHAFLEPGPAPKPKPKAATLT